VLTWLIAALATGALYFHHYDSAIGNAGAGPGYVFAHPVLGVEFFFFAIGDLTGGSLPGVDGYSDPVIIAIGVAVFLLAVVCLAAFVRDRSLSRSPVGPALICFGILLAISVTIGRAPLGLLGASLSRYVTEDLLILVGCYLCLLERWPGYDQESVATSFAPPASSAAVGAFRKADPIFPTLRDAWRQRLLAALRCAAILLIAVEVWGGLENGILSGAFARTSARYADLVAAHAACAPDALIRSALYPSNAYPYLNIRALAVAAKKDHLSFFATSEAWQLEHTKLPQASVSPHTSVLNPTSGALLRGNLYLVASASANCSLSAVNFRILGPGGQQYEALSAKHFVYGFFRVWSTTDIPNGVYTVQSKARDIAGNTGTSRAVPVTVQN
jgi:hypothetical protein